MAHYKIQTDLEIDAGAVYRLSIEYEGVDITGWTALSHFRRETDSDVIDLELSDANGRIVFTDPSNGRLDIVLMPEDTKALSGQYRYDLEIIPPNGEVERLIEGKVLVSAEVTR